MASRIGSSILCFVKQFLIVVLLFILQYTLFTRLSIWGAVPNLLLAYLVVVATSKDMTETVFVALLAGLLNDLVANRFFGFDLFFFLALAVGIHYLCERFVRGNFMIATLLMFVSSLLHAALFYAVNSFMAHSSGFFLYLLRHGVVAALYIMIPSFFILFFLDNHLYHPKKDDDVAFPSFK